MDDRHATPGETARPGTQEWSRVCGHSFFIYETDPVTGFPLAIAGNASRPSIRVWRTESARTPKRVFVRRIRPRLEWLESIVSPEAREADGPAPLAVAPAR